MSEQSLRDALKELADQRDSVSGHVASDYHIRPYELHELLVAHPAVPCLAPKVDRDQLVEAISARLHITTDATDFGDGGQRRLSADTSAVYEAADAVLALLSRPPA